MTKQMVVNKNLQFLSFELLWPSASEGDNESVRSSAPVVSRCFPGGYNVKLYISRGRLAWWLLAFLHSDS